MTIKLTPIQFKYLRALITAARHSMSNAQTGKLSYHQSESKCTIKWDQDEIKLKLPD